MLPTRSEAEKDVASFYTLIRELLENKNPLIKKRVTLANLAGVIGVDSSTIQRQLEKKTVSLDNRILILHYVFEERKALTGEWRDRAREFPHFLFFALLEFFEIKETSQDNARALISGTYELWRYSVEDDDEFVRGKIEFSTDPQTGAVCVEMHQPKKPRDGMRGINEVFHGYFIRIADMYAMLLKDVSNNDLRLTIFPRFRIERVGRHPDENSVFAADTLHIIHLDGFGLGIDGNNLFFSPVFVVLVDNKEEIAALDGKLDIVPEDQVPARILKRLKKFPRILK